jgi:hypothetical protein
MISCGTLPARWKAWIASANSPRATSGSPSDALRRAASRAMKPSKKWMRCSCTKATPSSHAASARRAFVRENAMPAIQSA